MVLQLQKKYSPTFCVADEYKKRKSATQGASSIDVIQNYFVEKFTPLKYKILAVGVTLVFHCVKHNYRYKSTDCRTNLI